MTLKKTLVAMAFLLVGMLSVSAQSKYKCLVQMNNYDGEKAYLVVSLIAPDGKYAKTLRVMGPNKRWYNSLKEWSKAQKANPEKLDAVTGASIGGGERSVVTLTLDDKLKDKGYKIRFETSVEDQDYHATDVEIPYSEAKLTEKVAGKGYIKMVKFSPVKK